MAVALGCDRHTRDLLFAIPPAAADWSSIRQCDKELYDTRSCVLFGRGPHDRELLHYESVGDPETGCFFLVLMTCNVDTACAKVSVLVKE